MPNKYGTKVEGACPLEELQLHFRWAFKTIGLTWIKTKMSHQLCQLGTEIETSTTHIHKHFELNAKKACFALNFSLNTTSKLKVSVGQKL